MALARFVLTANVTLTPDVAATPVAGEPGTGGAAGFGNEGTVSPGTSGKYGLYAGQYVKGQVIYADSTPAGTTGPCLLYQALGGSTSLRAYVPGQDDQSRTALGN